MGGAMSTSSGIRERLMSKTKTDNDMLNMIFEFMLKQATITDFYSVADPSRCKNYVLAGKEALMSLFVSLKIYPEKDPNKGVLYFQRIDGLKEGMPPELKEEQKGYCLELAFFFIRIFQIFGALTLSVMDVSIPSDLGEILKGTRAAVRPAFIGKTLPGFAGGGTVQRGGDLKGAWLIPNDNRYAILNQYLSRPTTQNANQLNFSNYYDMYIDFASMYTGTRDVPIFSEDPKPLIFYNFNTEDSIPGTIGASLILRQNGETIDLEMNNFTSTVGARTSDRKSSAKLTRFANGKYMYEGKELPAVIYKIMKAAAPPPAFSLVNFFKGFRYISGDSFNENREQQVRDTNFVILPTKDKNKPVLIRYRDEIRVKTEEREKKVQIIIDGCTLGITPKIQSSGLMLEFTVRVGFEGRRVTPAEFASTLTFKTYKESVFKRTHDSSEPTNDKGQTIPVYVQGVFKDIIEHREDDEGRGPKFTRTKEGYIVPHDSAEIPDSLRVKKLWEALTADPPVKAFCTARAMQLLSPAALEGAIPSAALTSICRTTFAYQSNGSVGKVGQSIDKILGIRAMAALFVDTLDKGVPKVTQAAQYQNFLRGFKTMFERVSEVPSAAPSSLGEITERLPPFCPPGENSRGTINDRGLIQKLRYKAIELIERQILHTGNVMKVISKLFTVDKSGRVLFNPFVKTKGIPYIDTVAAEARELLLKYYSDCEMKYTEGLQTLAQQRDGVKFESVSETFATESS